MKNSAILTVYNLTTWLNEKLGGGFLNSMPTDIWSLLYTKILKLAGATIGNGSKVHHRVIIKHPENITLGENILIPASTDMAGMGKIKIDDNSLIGASVRFITNHHPLDNKNLTRKEILRGTQREILVGKNCWIMNNVLLIAGTRGLKIGNNAWIAAGAVVTHDVEPNTVVGGIPAKLIKNL